MVNYDQGTTNEIVTLTANTATPLLPTLIGAQEERVAFSVYNAGPGTATVVLPNKQGVVQNGKGIVIAPGGTTAQSSDSGFKCWQGPVMIISTDASAISVFSQSING